MGTLQINYLRVLAKDLTLHSVYRSNQPLWKIQVIALTNLDCFIIGESNQVKIHMILGEL